MAGALLPLSQAAAAGIVDAAIDDYIAGCRRRIPGFVDRHFSLRGSLALHRNAMGWDLARAPANLLLAVPHLGIKAAGLGLGRLGAKTAGARLSGLDLIRRTRVAAAVGGLIERDLLHLAADADGADGMARALGADPMVDAALRTLALARERRLHDPDFRAALDMALTRYVETRVAASEVATALASLGIGAVAFKQVTPGLLSLGPMLAGALAQSAAISTFPLGAGLGGLWHSWFPASAGPALVAGVTGGLFLGVAVLSAFSGLVTDPAQRALGLHQRRLNKLVDGIEHALRRGEGLAFNPRDHYIARLIDLIDIARLAAS